MALLGDGYVFIHVYKTGGTSLRQILQGIDARDLAVTSIHLVTLQGLHD